MIVFKSKSHDYMYMCYVYACVFVYVYFIYIYTYKYVFILWHRTFLDYIKVHDKVHEPLSSPFSIRAILPINHLKILWASPF